MARLPSVDPAIFPEILHWFGALSLTTPVAPGGIAAHSWLRTTTTTTNTKRNK